MTPTKQEELQAFYQKALPGFIEYVRTHQSAIEEVELALTKDGIVSFPATQVLGGVQKTVRVPLSLITANADDAEALCRELAEYARQQGDYALAQALYSLEKGDYAGEQGDYAKAQGNAVSQLRSQMSAWYDSFRPGADNWYADITANVASWFSGVQSDWSTWFAARKQEWNTWFSGVQSDWSTWFAARKQEWNTWFSGVQSDWSTWFAARKEDWSTWFAARKQEWNTWFSGVQSDWSPWFAARKQEWSVWFAAAKEILATWTTKEQERQSAEEIRLEMMAHPPIPSERGYWMFWDMTVTPHAYVESGYSCRGTMDWPEFFWDYDTMGIGVITSRDYSRFSIDEQGRFKMKM